MKTKLTPKKQPTSAGGMLSSRPERASVLVSRKGAARPLAVAAFHWTRPARSTPVLASNLGLRRRAHGRRRRSHRMAHFIAADRAINCELRSPRPDAARVGFGSRRRRLPYPVAGCPSDPQGTDLRRVRFAPGTSMRDGADRPSRRPQRSFTRRSPHGDDWSTSRIPDARALRESSTT
jgi:hypothetical protein